MGQTLTEIAEKLRDADKKVQLIYAFNGSGQDAPVPRVQAADRTQRARRGEDDQIVAQKMLYYNAFTEDLFYWDNDLTAILSASCVSSRIRSPDR